MLFDKLLNKLFCLISLSVGVSNINNARIQDLSRFAYNRYLTAGSVARVKTDNNLSLDGRSKQKLLCIQCKDFNCVCGGIFREHISDFTLYGRINKPCICVLSGFAHSLGAGRTVGIESCSRYNICRLYCVKSYADFEKFFFFSAVNSQNSVTCNFVNGLGVIVIHCINAVSVLINGRYRNNSDNAEKISESAPYIRIVGNIFGNYVKCAF